VELSILLTSGQPSMIVHILHSSQPSNLITRGERCQRTLRETAVSAKYIGVMSETTEALPTKITMFGADWCSDCRRSEALLNSLNVDWEKVDVEKDPSAADRAQAISGRLSIPVVHFPDGTFQVEPSDKDLTAKLEELGAI